MADIKTFQNSKRITNKGETRAKRRGLSIYAGRSDKPAQKQSHTKRSKNFETLNPNPAKLKEWMKAHTSGDAIVRFATSTRKDQPKLTKGPLLNRLEPVVMARCIYGGEQTPCLEQSMQHMRKSIKFSKEQGWFPVEMGKKYMPGLRIVLKGIINRFKNPAIAIHSLMKEAKENEGCKGRDGGLIDTHPLWLNKQSPPTAFKMSWNDYKQHRLYNENLFGNLKECKHCHAINQLEFNAHELTMEEIEEKLKHFGCWLCSEDLMTEPEDETYGTIVDPIGNDKLNNSVGTQVEQLGIMGYLDAYETEDPALVASLINHDLSVFKAAFSRFNFSNCKIPAGLSAQEKKEIRTLFHNCNMSDKEGLTSADDTRRACNILFDSLIENVTGRRVARSTVCIEDGEDTVSHISSIGLHITAEEIVRQMTKANVNHVFVSAITYDHEKPKQTLMEGRATLWMIKDELALVWSDQDTPELYDRKSLEMLEYNNLYIGDKCVTVKTIAKCLGHQLVCLSVTDKDDGESQEAWKTSEETDELHATIPIMTPVGAMGLINGVTFTKKRIRIIPTLMNQLLTRNIRGNLGLQSLIDAGRAISIKRFSLQHKTISSNEITAEDYMNHAYIAAVMGLRFKWRRMAGNAIENPKQRLAAIVGTSMAKEMLKLVYNSLNIDPSRGVFGEIIGALDSQGLVQIHNYLSHNSWEDFEFKNLGNNLKLQKELDLDVSALISKQNNCNHHTTDCHTEGGELCRCCQQLVETVEDELCNCCTMKTVTVETQEPDIESEDEEAEEKPAMKPEETISDYRIPLRKRFGPQFASILENGPTTAWELGSIRTKLSTEEWHTLIEYSPHGRFSIQLENLEYVNHHPNLNSSNDCGMTAARITNSDYNPFAFKAATGKTGDYGVEDLLKVAELAGNNMMVITTVGAFCAKGDDTTDEFETIVHSGVLNESNAHWMPASYKLTGPHQGYHVPNNAISQNSRKNWLRKHYPEYDMTWGNELPALIKAKMELGLNPDFADPGSMTIDFPKYKMESGTHWLRNNTDNTHDINKGMFAIQVPSMYSHIIAELNVHGMPATSSFLNEPYNLETVDPTKVLSHTKQEIIECVRTLRILHFESRKEPGGNNSTWRGWRRCTLNRITANVYTIESEIKLKTLDMAMLKVGDQHFEYCVQVVKGKPAIFIQGTSSSKISAKIKECKASPGSLYRRINSLLRITDPDNAVRAMCTAEATFAPPGWGKSTEIIKYAAQKKCLVLAMTSLSQQSLRDRVQKPSAVRSIEWATQNGVEGFEEVIIDEATMVDPFTFASIVGDKQINCRLYGDRNQIGVIDTGTSSGHRLRTNVMQYVPKPRVMNVTRRFGETLCKELRSIGIDIVSECDWDTQVVFESRDFVDAEAIIDLVETHKPDQILTFHNNTKRRLQAHLDSTDIVETVHRYQGREADVVMVVQNMPASGLSSLIFDRDYIVSACSRARKKLVWVSVGISSTGPDLKSRCIYSGQGSQPGTIKDLKDSVKGLLQLATQTASTGRAQEEPTGQHSTAKQSTQPVTISSTTHGTCKWDKHQGTITYDRKIDWGIMVKCITEKAPNNVRVIVSGKTLTFKKMFVTLGSMSLLEDQLTISVTGMARTNTTQKLADEGYKTYLKQLELENQTKSSDRAMTIEQTRREDDGTIEDVVDEETGKAIFEPTSSKTQSEWLYDSVSKVITSTLNVNVAALHQALLVAFEDDIKITRSDNTITCTRNSGKKMSLRADGSNKIIVTIDHGLVMDQDSTDAIHSHYLRSLYYIQEMENSDGIIGATQDKKLMREAALPARKNCTCLNKDVSPPEKWFIEEVGMYRPSISSAQKVACLSHMATMYQIAQTSLPLIINGYRYTVRTRRGCTLCAGIVFEYKGEPCFYIGEWYSDAPKRKFMLPLGRDTNAADNLAFNLGIDEAIEEHGPRLTEDPQVARDFQDPVMLTGMVLERIGVGLMNGYGALKNLVTNQGFEWCVQALPNNEKTVSEFRKKSKTRGMEYVEGHHTHYQHMETENAVFRVEVNGLQYLTTKDLDYVCDPTEVHTSGTINGMKLISKEEYFNVLKQNILNSGPWKLMTTVLKLVGNKKVGARGTQSLGPVEGMAMSLEQHEAKKTAVYTWLSERIAKARLEQLKSPPAMFYLTLAQKTYYASAVRESFPTNPINESSLHLTSDGFDTVLDQMVCEYSKMNNLRSTLITQYPWVIPVTSYWRGFAMRPYTADGRRQFAIGTMVADSAIKRAKFNYELANQHKKEAGKLQEDLKYIDSHESSQVGHIYRKSGEDSPHAKTNCVMYGSTMPRNIGEISKHVMDGKTVYYITPLESAYQTGSLVNCTETGNKTNIQFHHGSSIQLETEWFNKLRNGDLSRDINSRVIASILGQRLHMVTKDPRRYYSPLDHLDRAGFVNISMPLMINDPVRNLKGELFDIEKFQAPVKEYEALKKRATVEGTTLDDLLASARVMLSTQYYSNSATWSRMSTSVRTIQLLACAVYAQQHSLNKAMFQTLRLMRFYCGDKPKLAALKTRLTDGLLSVYGKILETLGLNIPVDEIAERLLQFTSLKASPAANNMLAIAKTMKTEFTTVERKLYKLNSDSSIQERLEQHKNETDSTYVKNPEPTVTKPLPTKIKVKGVADVLIVGLGSAGDMIPLGVASNTISGMGHNVTMITGDDFSDNDHLSDRVKQISAPAQVKEAMESFAANCDPSIRMDLEAAKRSFTEANLAILDTVGLKKKYDLVITNAFTLSADVIAEYWNCPLGILVSQPWTSVISRVANRVDKLVPEYLSSKLHWLTLATAAKLVEPRLNSVRRQNNLQEVDQTARFRRSTAKYAMTNPRLVEWYVPGVTQGNWETIPSSRSITREVYAWVRANKPVLLTFGSMTGARVNSATAAILGILEQQPVLMVGGDHEVIKSEIHKHMKWVDYGKIMKYCRFIITHGGSGTVHAALESTCPIAVLPIMGDQLYWANVVAKKKIGLKLTDSDKYSGIDYMLANWAEFRNNMCALNKQEHETTQLDKWLQDKFDLGYIISDQQEPEGTPSEAKSITSEELRDRYEKLIEEESENTTTDLETDTEQQISHVEDETIEEQDLDPICRHNWASLSPQLTKLVMNMQDLKSIETTFNVNVRTNNLLEYNNTTVQDPIDARALVGDYQITYNPEVNRGCVAAVCEHQILDNKVRAMLKSLWKNSNSADYVDMEAIGPLLKVANLDSDIVVGSQVTITRCFESRGKIQMAIKKTSQGLHAVSVTFNSKHTMVHEITKQTMPTTNANKLKTVYRGHAVKVPRKFEDALQLALGYRKFTHENLTLNLANVIPRLQGTTAWKILDQTKHSITAHQYGKTQNGYRIWSNTECLHNCELVWMQGKHRFELGLLVEVEDAWELLTAANITTESIIIMRTRVTIFDTKLTPGKQVEIYDKAKEAQYLNEQTSKTCRRLGINAHGPEPRDPARDLIITDYDGMPHHGRDYTGRIVAAGKTRCLFPMTDSCIQIYEHLTELNDEYRTAGISAGVPVHYLHFSEALTPVQQQILQNVTKMIDPSTCIATAGPYTKLLGKTGHKRNWPKFTMKNTILHMGPFRKQATNHGLTHEEIEAIYDTMVIDHEVRFRVKMVESVQEKHIEELTSCGYCQTRDGLLMFRGPALLELVEKKTKKPPAIVQEEVGKNDEIDWKAEIEKSRIVSEKILAARMSAIPVDETVELCDKDEINQREAMEGDWDYREDEYVTENPQTTEIYTKLNTGLKIMEKTGDGDWKITQAAIERFGAAVAFNEDTKLTLESELGLELPVISDNREQQLVLITDTNTTGQPNSDENLRLGSLDFKNIWNPYSNNRKEQVETLLLEAAGRTSYNLHRGKVHHCWYFQKPVNSWFRDLIPGRAILRSDSRTLICGSVFMGLLSKFEFANDIVGDSLEPAQNMPKTAAMKVFRDLTGDTMAMRTLTKLFGNPDGTVSFSVITHSTKTQLDHNALLTLGWYIEGDKAHFIKGSQTLTKITGQGWKEEEWKLNWYDLKEDLTEKFGKQWSGTAIKDQAWNNIEWKRIAIAMPSGSGKTTLHDENPSKYQDIDDLISWSDWDAIERIKSVEPIDWAAINELWKCRVEEKADGRILLCHSKEQLPKGWEFHVVIPKIHHWKKWSKDNLKHLLASSEKIYRVPAGMTLDTLITRIADGQQQPDKVPNQGINDTAMLQFFGLDMPTIKNSVAGVGSDSKYGAFIPITEGLLCLGESDYSKEQANIDVINMFEDRDLLDWIVIYGPKQEGTKIGVSEVPGKVIKQAKTFLTKYPIYSRPVLNKVTYTLTNAVTGRLMSKEIVRTENLHVPTEVNDFLSTYGSENISTKLKSFKQNLITFSPEAIREWLRSRPDEVKVETELLEILKEGFATNPLNQIKVHTKVESLLKENPIGLMKETQARLIAWQCKGLCAMYSEAFKSLKTRFKSILNNTVLYADGLTPTQLAARVRLIGKDVVFFENDLTKQDRQIDHQMLSCEFGIYEALGVSNHLLKSWRTIHNMWRFKGEGVTGQLDSMRLSGQATTAIGNVIVNLFVHKKMYKDNRKNIELMLALGDDNLVISKSKLMTGDLRHYIASNWNMHCKPNHYDNYGTFCCMLAYKTDTRAGLGADWVRLRRRYEVTNGVHEATPELIKARGLSYLQMIGATVETEEIMAAMCPGTKLEQWYDVDYAVQAMCEKYNMSIEEVYDNYKELLDMIRDPKPITREWLVTGNFNNRK